MNVEIRIRRMADFLQNDFKNVTKHSLVSYIYKDNVHIQAI